MKSTSAPIIAACRSTTSAMARTASSGDSTFSWFFEPSGVNSGAGRLTLSAQVPQICWGGSIIVCANRVAATTKAIAHTRYHGYDRAHSTVAKMT